MVHDKLFSKYSCEIYTLNLWYNSCKCSAGPGLMESVSFMSCHRWCFCISTAVFAHLGPSCHGLGLCLPQVPASTWCRNWGDSLVADSLLESWGSGNRSAESFNVGLHFLEGMDVLGQTFSPWAAALAGCKEHGDLKMRWEKKTKYPFLSPLPQGDQLYLRKKLQELLAVKTGRNCSSSESSVSLYTSKCHSHYNQRAICKHPNKPLQPLLSLHPPLSTLGWQWSTVWLCCCVCVVRLPGLFPPNVSYF